MFPISCVIVLACLFGNFGDNDGPAGVDVSLPPIHLGRIEPKTDSRFIVEIRPNLKEDMTCTGLQKSCVCTGVRLLESAEVKKGGALNVNLDLKAGDSSLSTKTGEFAMLMKSENRQLRLLQPFTYEIKEEVFFGTNEQTVVEFVKGDAPSLVVENHSQRDWDSAFAVAVVDAKLLRFEGIVVPERRSFQAHRIPFAGLVGEQETLTTQIDLFVHENKAPQGLFKLAGSRVVTFTPKTLVSVKPSVLYRADLGETFTMRLLSYRQAAGFAPGPIVCKAMRDGQTLSELEVQRIDRSVHWVEASMSSKDLLGLECNKLQIAIPYSERDLEVVEVEVK